MSNKRLGTAIGQYFKRWLAALVQQQAWQRQTSTVRLIC
ncbi:hypothetical protein AVDCRST_MAG94-2576 [uncultured Leptolyngbya sp.]|uniref:Uncharacterized protein n=1 Tax=uncultured Leptolyngbya sp. TaxID=332963 RepID=A0A6J4M110_9CYAN|nr:hypothetical protein AVDCRST_MAG94-2576 [uncultured Leptolyngbya sp.]